MSSRLRWDVEGQDWPLRESSRFVEGGGLRWHVQMLGSGPPVLLLHGTGASTHSWREVAPLLAAEATVVSVDLPGHGFTEGRPRGGLGLPGMAGAVAALLAALGVEPVLVAGHSAGAAIAARLTLDGGAAAPILAIAPALLPFPGLSGPIFSGMAGLVLANPLAAHFISGLARDEERVARFMAKSTGSRLDARGVALYRRLFASPEHCRGTIAMMAAWDLYGLQRALPGLAVPVHVLHGDRDSAIPAAAAKRAAGTVRHGRFELIPGLGHLLHEERPELAVAAMRAILAGA